MPAIVSKLPFISGLRRATQLSRSAISAARQAYDPKKSQTYYPGEPLKSRRQIALERARWTFRHRRRPYNYYMFGLDRVGTSIDDYMSFPEYTKLTSSRNWAPVGEGYNYRCVLVDKFVFGQVMASLGHSTVTNLAFLTSETIEAVGTRETAPLATILGWDDLDGFCKPLDGGHGADTFRLRVEAESLYLDDEASTIEVLSGRLGRRSLLQQRLTQHQELDRLYPGAINTLRIMTVLENGVARVLSVILRVGALGNVIDNFSAGGLIVHVDPASGCLLGRGFHKEGKGDGRSLARHPDTGVEFNGFDIPMLDESISLACRVHEDLPYFHTVGWDVAMTPDAPVVIEGNETWHVGMALALEPGFKRQLLDLYL